MCIEDFLKSIFGTEQSNAAGKWRTRASRKSPARTISHPRSACRLTNKQTDLTTKPEKNEDDEGNNDNDDDNSDDDDNDDDNDDNDNDDNNYDDNNDDNNYYCCLAATNNNPTTKTTTTATREHHDLRATCSSTCPQRVA